MRYLAQSQYYTVINIYYTVTVIPGPDLRRRIDMHAEVFFYEELAQGDHHEAITEDGHESGSDWEAEYQAHYNGVTPEQSAREREERGDHTDAISLTEGET